MSSSQHDGRIAAIKCLLFLATAMMMIVLSSCNLPIQTGRTISKPDVVEKAQVILTATSLQPLATDEQIQFVIVDEVTGVPYQQERLAMSLMEDGSYGVVYAASVGTVITYYFQKISPDGDISTEVRADGTLVWYRRYLVNEAGLVKETIAGWEDAPPETGQTGEINGVIMSAELGEPLRDILVSAGGAQTVSDAYGRFSLYPVVPGHHSLTAISMTGTYQPTQHNIIADTGKVTLADLTMSPSPWKEVTFKVQVPADTIEGAAVRLAGNLAQLGNSFHDLGGGISGDASKMPIMTGDGSGWLTLSMILPAGIDIRYKFTLGDGFWNAEHGLDQSFVTHQLIIPNDSGPVTIEDQVSTWRSSDTETIWFRADLPAHTPADETIGVQFKIAEWLPALPMLQISDLSRAFPLISPHNFSGEIPYRFCRETPCTGLGQAGIESLDSSRFISTRFHETHLSTEPVANWTFFSATKQSFAQITNISPREPGFIGGISFSPFSPHSELGYEQTNHVILSPAWIANPIGHPRMLAPSLTETLRWNQITTMIHAALDQGKTTSVHPQVLFPHGSADWWQAQPTSEENFWLAFLTEYREFVYQYAEQAAIAGADNLILGGEWLLPALPFGDNFITYSQPGNIEEIMAETIKGARDRFSGEIGFVLSIEMAEDPPSFLSEADTLYLLWDQPLEEGLSSSEKYTALGNALDEIAEPLASDLEKPLVILLAIPSLQGYHQSCIPSPNDEGECVDTSMLKLGPVLENPAAADIQMQAEYYSAFLSAATERSWIAGVISQGYYPELAMKDTSATIHGKPAEEIFENWLQQVIRN